MDFKPSVFFLFLLVYGGEGRRTRARYYERSETEAGSSASDTGSLSEWGRQYFRKFFTPAVPCSGFARRQTLRLRLAPLILAQRFIDDHEDTGRPFRVFCPVWEMALLECPRHLPSPEVLSRYYAIPALLRNNLHGERYDSAPCFSPWRKWVCRGPNSTRMYIWRSFLYTV